MSDPGPTVTDLQRDSDGHWRARVNGIAVDRRYGSWQAERDDLRRDVLPHVAAALQERVRPLERAEKRAEPKPGEQVSLNV